MGYYEGLCKYYENILSCQADKMRSAVVRKCIRKLQSHKRDSNMLQSDEDSGLENLWDEVCVQTQFQYFWNWCLYEDYMKDLICSFLKDMFDENELNILWSQTEEFVEWLDEYYDNPKGYLHKCNIIGTYCLDNIMDLIFDDLISVSVNYTNARIEKYLGM